MDAEWRTELAGEPVHLLGARALYRPQARALLIADLHLGKGDAFRRAGLAIPGGGTAHDLQRLDALLALHPSDVLWILGDLLHGPAPRAHWLAAWHAWREGHRGLRIRVLRGNHDRAFDASVLDVEDAGIEQRDGPFLLRHDPRPARDAHVLCGHLHPLAALPGMRRRWPAFWLRDGLTVLPAFSAFTAGVVPMQKPGERLVACVEGEAFALPPWSR
ncbi:metallophosphoesterase [Pseudoxanthomonas suwonensis 11-1]|uniref:Metallophosphoesterase n=1 Tax=Pseudoxanthomonas suwonensis (strain 11-1) TaxID=743721 RepID=E6WPU7_PSEUU|nr:ligase-associated DNA damage response endonuclease PdeM [Pseudoxanthomonas suwonensis]ADV26125.1 metallophosphoesterase [Pseudoxanthomonas suwonensis 11-1]